MSDRHDWNSWEHYRAIHDRKIQDYLDHFILEDQLDAEQAGLEVRWKGILYCADGIEIHVQKLMDVRYQSGRAYVKTRLYSYHVQRRMGRRVINLFRYDNAHPHPEHPSPHHRHQYDETGAEVEPVQHVGPEGWPTLGDVIDWAHQVWLGMEGHPPQQA